MTGIVNFSSWGWVVMVNLDIAGLVSTTLLWLFEVRDGSIERGDDNRIVEVGIDDELELAALMMLVSMLVVVLVVVLDEVKDSDDFKLRRFKLRARAE